MNFARSIAAPRHKNAGRPPEKDAPGFKQYVRGRSCLFAADGTCEGDMVAMHLDFAGGKGMSTKVADRFCVPSCDSHHERQHRWGWDTFCGRLHITKDDLIEASKFLWLRWPGRPAWERKQEQGR